MEANRRISKPRVRNKKKLRVIARRHAEPFLVRSSLTHYLVPALWLLVATLPYVAIIRTEKVGQTDFWIYAVFVASVLFFSLAGMGFSQRFRSGNPEFQTGPPADDDDADDLTHGSMR